MGWTMNHKNKCHAEPMIVGECPHLLPSIIKVQAPLQSQICYHPPTILPGSGSQQLHDDDHPDREAPLHHNEHLRVPWAQHGGPPHPWGLHLQHHRQAKPLRRVG